MSWLCIREGICKQEKRKERPSHFLLDLSDVAVDRCLEWLDVKSAIIIGIQYKVFCVQRSTLLKDMVVMQFDAQRVSKCF